MEKYYEFQGLNAFDAESREIDLEQCKAVHIVDYIGGGLFRLHVLGEIPTTWDDGEAAEVPTEWRTDDPVYQLLEKRFSNLTPKV